MTEHYSFFDPILVNGKPDRDYNAEEFTRFFRALVTTGLMKGEGNELRVSVNGSNMISTIDDGVAFVVGKQYWNDAPLEHIHDTETLGKSRIDRIVVRMNLATEVRSVKSYILKGVASVSPVAPALTQTPSYYEISLAQIKVVGGQTYISVDDVIDERGKDIICPWAGSNIFPSFDDNLLAKHMEDYIEHTPYVVTTGTSTLYEVDLGPSVKSLVEGLSIAVKFHVTNTGFAKINVNGFGDVTIATVQFSQTPAGTLQKDTVHTLRYNGTYFILQGTGALNNTLTSTSTTEAATANTVKQLNDLIRVPALSVRAISPFTENLNGAFYLHKNGDMVILSVRVTATSQLSTASIYQLCEDIPVGYRPKSTALGFLYYHVSPTSRTVAVTVNGHDGMVIMQNPPVNVPAGYEMSGHIVWHANQ